MFRCIFQLLNADNMKKKQQIFHSGLQGLLLYSAMAVLCFCPGNLQAQGGADKKAVVAESKASKPASGGLVLKNVYKDAFW